MSFFGSEFSHDQLEAIGLTIDPIHRTDVPGEMAARWFDYREMHPVAASYLYASLYKAAVFTFNERYVDILTASEARAFVPDDVFKGREGTSMWLARACADRICCPYDIALAFASKRALDRTFQRFPRPNQLSGEEFEYDLRDHWKAMCGYSLQHSSQEKFRMAHTWAVLRQEPPPEVVAHRDWLIASVKSRMPPHHNLLGRLLKEGALTTAWLTEGFDAATVANARIAANALIT